MSVREKKNNSKTKFVHFHAETSPSQPIGCGLQDGTPIWPPEVTVGWEASWAEEGTPPPGLGLQKLKLPDFFFPKNKLDLIFSPLSRAGASKRVL